MFRPGDHEDVVRAFGERLARETGVEFVGPPRWSEGGFTGLFRHERRRREVMLATDKDVKDRLFRRESEVRKELVVWKRQIDRWFYPSHGPRGPWKR
ncbi:MAG: hypothetical protein RDU89_07135 [bacterium]|nr:hypothetical protein [bacterium]